MPRSRGGASGGRRPSAAPASRSAPTSQQTRLATTAAHPQQYQQQQARPAQQQQGQGSGLFGQMASTAAGVAVGSTLGHAMSNMFFGGSGHQEAAPVDPYANSSQAMSPELYGGNTNASMQAQQQSGPCVSQVTGFKQCMEQNNSDLTICGWYLDQLKACQAAASKY